MHIHRARGESSPTFLQMNLQKNSHDRGQSHLRLRIFDELRIYLGIFSYKESEAENTMKIESHCWTRKPSVLTQSLEDLLPKIMRSACTRKPSALTQSLEDLLAKFLLDVRILDEFVENCDERRLRRVEPGEQEDKCRVLCY